MREDKAESWNSGLDSEASAELNHAVVVRQTLTKSKSPDPRDMERDSKNDFFPFPSNDADKFLNHSSLACSSSSSYS